MRGSDNIIPLRRAIELKWMRELLRESSDIREDMVVSLRNEILRNVYEIEAELVAEKIIGHGIYIS